MGGKKRGKYPHGHFVQLHDYMTNSKAWRKLSCNAVWAYVEMKKKYRGNNKNNLSLTYKEVRYKMSSATYSKTIKELVNRGFIDIVRPGGLFKNCSIYGLSDRWKEKSKAL